MNSGTGRRAPRCLLEEPVFGKLGEHWAECSLPGQKFSPLLSPSAWRGHGLERLCPPYPRRHRERALSLRASSPGSPSARYRDVLIDGLVPQPSSGDNPI